MEGCGNLVDPSTPITNPALTLLCSLDEHTNSAADAYVWCDTEIFIFQGGSIVAQLFHSVFHFIRAEQLLSAFLFFASIMFDLLELRTPKEVFIAGLPEKGLSGRLRRAKEKSLEKAATRRQTEWEVMRNGEIMITNPAPGQEKHAIEQKEFWRKQGKTKDSAQKGKNMACDDRRPIHPPRGDHDSLIRSVSRNRNHSRSRRRSRHQRNTSDANTYRLGDQARRTGSDMSQDGPKQGFHERKLNEPRLRGRSRTPSLDEPVRAQRPRVRIKSPNSQRVYRSGQASGGYGGDSNNESLLRGQEDVTETTSTTSSTSTAESTRVVVGRQEAVDQRKGKIRRREFPPSSIGHGESDADFNASSDASSMQSLAAGTQNGGTRSKTLIAWKPASITSTHGVSGAALPGLREPSRRRQARDREPNDPWNFDNLN